jgi:hypothetical protein
MASLTDERRSSSIPPSDALTSLEDGKKTPVAITAVEEDYTTDLRHSPEARMAFLATFSAEEEKTIMKKVDTRFLVLIGLMFLFKNVSGRILR